MQRQTVQRQCCWQRRGKSEAGSRQETGSHYPQPGSGSPRSGSAQAERSEAAAGSGSHSHYPRSSSGARWSDSARSARPSSARLQSRNCRQPCLLHYAGSGWPSRVGGTQAATLPYLRHVDSLGETLVVEPVLDHDGGRVRGRAGRISDADRHVGSRAQVHHPRERRTFLRWELGQRRSARLSRGNGGGIVRCFAVRPRELHRLALH